MNRTIKKFSSWIATVALWGAQVAVLQAAQLDSFSGKVLINRGDGFESAGQLAQLKAGDKLMVSQSGQATLAFQSCHVTFTGANLYTVPAIRPCASGGDIAIANGVFVTPVAAPVSQAEQLDGITALGRSIQSAAQTSNDAIGLSCVNGKLGEIAALRHFLSRNPGVDETARIGQLRADVGACGHPMPQLQATAPAAPAPSVAPVVAPAGDGTMIAVGVGGLAALGGGAFLLLAKKSCASGVSAC